MATWNTVVTTKGLALQTKQVSGATIAFSRVLTGSGIVPIVKIQNQTAVSNIVQELSVASLTVNENTYAIKVLLTNKELLSSYYLSQIGFYAMDPDEGEILFALAQIDEPKKIPTNSESPGYEIDFIFTFANENQAEITVNVDTGRYVTVGEFQTATDELQKATDELQTAVSELQKGLDDLVELGEDIEE